MSDPIPFLTALSQALSTMTLYGGGHPARERGLRQAYAAMAALFLEEPDLQFSFLSGDVVHGNRVLRELKGWEWGHRLAAIGIERLEFVPPVGEPAFDEFVRTVHEQLRDRPQEPLAPQFPDAGIRFGRVSLGGEALEALAAKDVLTAVDFPLTEELEALQWVHDEAARKDEVPMVETETIVRSLALAMHHEGQVVLPLLALEDLDRYTTTHSCNVAVLAMGMAEYLGYAPREVRALGVAALLHDVGNVKVPAEVLRKTGSLAPDERRAMERHTAEGARLILSRHPHMDLAAVVAYEHHLRHAGGGYPTLVFPRAAHYASRIVQVCDVYDAMMSARPWRPAFTPQAALGILESESGTTFDPDLVQSFATMLRQARSRHLSPDDPSVAVTTSVGS